MRKSANQSREAGLTYQCSRQYPLEWTHLLSYLSVCGSPTSTANSLNRSRPLAPGRRQPVFTICTEKLRGSSPMENAGLCCQKRPKDRAIQFRPIIMVVDVVGRRCPRLPRTRWDRPPDPWTTAKMWRLWMLSARAHQWPPTIRLRGFLQRSLPISVSNRTSAASSSTSAHRSIEHRVA